MEVNFTVIDYIKKLIKDSYKFNKMSTKKTSAKTPATQHLFQVRHNGTKLDDANFKIGQFLHYPGSIGRVDDSLLFWTFVATLWPAVECMECDRFQWIFKHDL